MEILVIVILYCLWCTDKKFIHIQYGEKLFSNDFCHSWYLHRYEMLIPRQSHQRKNNSWLLNLRKCEDTRKDHNIILPHLSIQRHFGRKIQGVS